MESTTPTWDGEKNPNFCGKCFVAINHNGKIRSCNGDMSTEIGDIETPFKELCFSHRWSAKNLSECNGCEWIIWCQGGCPLTRKLAYGTYEYRSPFCSAFKELFPRLMKLKERWVV